MKKIYLHFLHCAAGYAGVCRKFSSLVTCMKFNYISLFWCLHDVFSSAPPYDGESEKFLVCKSDPKPVLTKTKPDAIAPIQQTRQMEHLSGKQPWRANIAFSLRLGYVDPLSTPSTQRLIVSNRKASSDQVRGTQMDHYHIPYA